MNLHDTITGKEVRQVVCQKEPCFAAFAPDGSSLAIGGIKQALEVRDLRTGEVRKTLSKQVFPIRFVQDGNLLVIEASPNHAKPARLLLWDMQKDQELANPGSCSIEALFIQPYAVTGKSLAKTTQGNIEIWDLDSVQTRARFQAGRAAMVRFSPDGRYLASVTEEGLRVWDTLPIKEVQIQAPR